MKAPTDDWRRLVGIRTAILHLQDARDQLRKVKARRARAYVARAIKSAQGAEQNALRFANRRLREAGK
jgi:hypothetical protein